MTEIYKLENYKNRFNFVYIHGFNSVLDSFKNFFKSLHGEGFNVYSFELPNHGDNYSYKKQFSYVEYVEYCIKRINDLKLDNVILMGHSMGGAIVANIFNSIENLNGVIFLSPLTEKPMSLVELAIRRTYINNTNLPIPLFNKIHPDNKGFDARKLSIDIFESKNLTLYSKDLDKLIKPSLLFVGEKDIVLNHETTLKHLSEKIPNIEKHILKTGHSPHREDTENVVKKINEWIKKNFKYS